MPRQIHTITLIPGDGIGPEVTSSARRIIEAAGVRINWEICEAGAAVFKKGIETGVPQETIDSIMRNRIALKGPLETPVGFGEKSANVTLRKMFETYGNIRPVKEIPGVRTPYYGRAIDFVIVRENIEDLYAGIEHMQTPNVAQCLKLISRKGCEKIVRLAFEFARSEGRKMVHCATKANIMKLSEGLLKRTFEEISRDYPDIAAHHIIVDNCAHQLVKKPEQFDVIVTTNMNGDILSDLGSALIGGLGFAPGANIGDDFAIFEAVHGSAPKYAGKNVINPTAVLLSGVMMLRYLGEFEAAEMIEEALYKTLKEDGVLTKDVVGDKACVSTSVFTDAIIANLGETCRKEKKSSYKPIHLPKVPKDPVTIRPKDRSLNGIDIFIELDKPVEVLGEILQRITISTPFEFKVLSCRGVKVYPRISLHEPDLVDHVCARFIAKDPAQEVSDTMLIELLQKVSHECHWVHLEKLNTFDGKIAYSKTHGE